MWWVQELWSDRDNRVGEPSDKRVHNNAFSGSTQGKQRSTCSGGFHGFIIFLLKRSYIYIYSTISYSDEDDDDREPALKYIYNDLCVQKREDGEWMKHTLGYWEDEKVRLEYRPVHMDTLDDEIETFPPKARVYWFLFPQTSKLQLFFRCHRNNNIRRKRGN